MLKTFSYNDNIKLSKNFTSREFRCKCGKAHDYKIETALIEKLQALTDVLEADKVIINSGYRCPAHDRNVGGNGYGQHTKGTAADIVCYDSKGRVISSKIVCCAAQDIGFGGIANIDSTYTATHVDVRSSNLWKGDEVRTTAYSITNDFYKYYKLSEADVYGKKRTYNTTSKSDVKSLQNALNAKGFNCGSADGIIGNNTLKAMFSALCELMLGE